MHEVRGGQLRQTQVGLVRERVAGGADGARPHHHALSTETFYVLEGKVEFLLGDEMRSVSKGGLVVVPPGTRHAFGVADGVTAEMLVVMTPGVERFGYFRRLGRAARGEAAFESVLGDQDRYDVHFAESEVGAEGAGPRPLRFKHAAGQGGGGWCRARPSGRPPHAALPSP
ncbi:cupin domain-containing protein [Streptomyces sp. I05A-00742]|uniref:cupin domain-containing protein n=1 Tax=Streptomyces sp. I05A-00742 TaxID=2732853 RepID=UPI0014883964|nr:cupin domain-containing protein [Streptomyces sp. I05A-00742]